MRVTQTILEREENSTLKWYGYVVRMEKTWPKRIWPGHREVGNDEDDPKWEKEVKRVMKQRNVTSGDAVNKQLRRLTTSNRWTTGKNDTKIRDD